MVVWRKRGPVAAAVPSSGSADRLTWSPGDAAQCDLWFPSVRIPLEDSSCGLLPVLVIHRAHSRFTTGLMIPTRKTEDLLLRSWELSRSWAGCCGD